MQSLQGLDLVKITHHVSQINDNTTCIECCKYYIAPETATCGHTLCHSCWIGRRACPYCSKSVARRQLKLNRHTQIMTECAQSLSEAVQRLFHIKLDEVLIENDQPPPPAQHDHTKNVTDWLASSQNHFSAFNTEEQSHELLQNPNPVNVSIDKIQIHSHTHTPNNPEKVICVPVAQDDWDKIEPMPNTEDVLKNKENVVGPMDIEPFDFEDSEYTAKHPRRSSRKREPKPLADNVTKNINNSLEKQNSSNFSEEIDKKSNKTKQTWNNVKRMRKEFSKLNRKNRNKLNVSIEMCKKTQILAKASTAIPKVDSPKIYDIDEDTPVGIIEKQKTRVLTEGQNINQEAIQIQPKIYDKDEDIPVVEIIEKQKKRVLTEEQNINPEKIHVQPNSFSNKNRSSTDNEAVHTVLQKNNKHKTLRTSNDEAITDKGSNENKVTSQSSEHVLIQSQNNSLKMPFYKKSSLNPKCTKQKPDDIVTHTVLSNNSSNDDIEISIKVGNTITNILIKRKNDVELKVKTDREIQTSLGSHNISSNNEVIVSIGDYNKEGDLDHQTINPRIEEMKKAATSDKTVSEKKNTDSADTASAQFEITESVEKELSKNMEYADNNQPAIKSKSMKQKSTRKVSEPAIKGNTDDYMNDLDLDIFDSESIKASGVKLLKDVCHAPSEIIPCTTKTKNRTQKHNNKRDRQHNNDENILPKSKQRKLNDESAINKSIEPRKTKPNESESEPMNYDVIMGTVFASIDADIEAIHQSQNIEATSDIRNKDINDMSKVTQIDVGQEVVSATAPNELQSNNSPADDHYSNQKDSENLFSVCVDKDDMNEEPATAIEKEPPNVATSNIEEFLTPVMCRELQSTDVLMVEHDDSDKSVVEETPQKSTSFTKVKAKSTVLNKDVNQSQRIDKQDQKVLLEKARSKANSIVELVDTTMESRKDVTVIETVAQRALETPSTIDKFAGDIKYKSTPMARKSLQFESENMDDLDPEQTLCPTNEVIGKTTQEKEFLRQVFEKTLSTADAKPVSRKLALKHNKFCIAGTCLSSVENAKLKQLCSRQNWTYTTTFSKELTHLVVGVDEENRSQRSVKFMSALSSSKWIISFEWVEKCLQSGSVISEEPYEALDSTGEPGPRRSRLAAKKLFDGITFYCMEPFGVLDVDTLNSMLESSGGKVVKEVKEVRVTSTSSAPALLLAEPEHTQEDRFIYLAMELNIVPVNYEWALNCLGSYTLGSIHELLLCPSTILPKAIHQWPQELLARDDD